MQIHIQFSNKYVSYLRRYSFKYTNLDLNKAFECRRHTFLAIKLINLANLKL